MNTKNSSGNNMIEKIEEIAPESWPYCIRDCATGDLIGVIVAPENFEFLMDHHNALVRKFNELAEVVNKMEGGE